MIVAGLAVWTVILILSPPVDPLIHSNRLALYWGEDRWRWFLMFAAGASGLCGLVRLARRGEPLPLIWFAGCYGIALLGLAGLPVPVWWRFLLLGQIPLAIGTAIVLVEAKRSVPKRLVQGTLVFALLFKLATLITCRARSRTSARRCRRPTRSDRSSPPTLPGWWPATPSPATTCRPPPATTP